MAKLDLFRTQFQILTHQAERLKNKLWNFGFGLALLLLLGAAIGFYLAISQLKKEQHCVEHTYKVIEQIDNILFEINNAERGRRGYILTQDSIYLKTYEYGIKQTQKAVDNLQRLTVNSPQQQENLKTLKSLIQQRLLLSQQSLNLLKEQSLDKLIQIQLTHRGKSLQDQIDILLDKMERSERQVLWQRQQMTSNRIYQITFIVGVGYFLSFSLLLIIYRQLKQEIHHRQKAEQNLSQINEQLETRIENRTLELTQLNIILKNEIEERKQLEHLLRESEERFRQAIFEAPLPIIIHAEDGEILQINWAWSEISGYQPEQIPTLSAWTEKVYGENHQVIRAYIRQLFQLNQRVAEGEFTLTNRQGKTLIWDFYSAPLKTLFDGRKVRITMALDVTQRKQAELALYASERRYSTLSELAPVGIFRSDSQGNCIYVNQKWCQITGLTPEQALGTGWISSLHPEDRQRVITQWNYCLSHQTLFSSEYRFQDLQGEITWVVGQAIAETTPKGEIIGYIGTLTDITARKHTEQALSTAKAELEIRVEERTAELKDSNEKLQQELAEKQKTQIILAEQAQLLDLAHDVIMSRDLKGMILFWNQGAEKVYGFSKTEALGHNSHALLKTQFPEPIKTIFTRLFADNYWEGELIQHKRDGQKIIVASRWVLQRDQRGKPSKILEINNDITARKQAEEALQQNEAKFRSLCESSPIGIFLTDTQGQILYTNPRYLEIAGANAKDVLGEGWKQFIHPEDHETIISDWSANLGQQQNSFYPEIRFHHKNGPIRYGNIYTSAIFTENGQLTGFVGTVEDITERRQIEQMKKDFISVVSHELRTPLTAIHGSLGLLAAGVYDNKPEKGKK